MQASTFYAYEVIKVNEQGVLVIIYLKNDLHLIYIGKSEVYILLFTYFVHLILFYQTTLY